MASVPGWVPAEYVSDVAVSSAKWNVSPALLAGLLKVESGFNPRAQSGAGAEGIAQFEPATAAAYGVNPWDPTSSIDGAAHYLSDMLTQFGGDQTLALAAYNGGPGAISNDGTPSKATAEYAAIVEKTASSPDGNPANGTATGKDLPTETYKISVTDVQWKAIQGQWKGTAAGFDLFKTDTNNNGAWHLDDRKAVDKAYYQFSGTQAELNAIVQTVVDDSAHNKTVTDLNKPANLVKNAINSVGDLVKLVGGIVNFFQNASLRNRILLGGLGMLVVIAGFYFITGGLGGNGGGTKVVPIPV